MDPMPVVAGDAHRAHDPPYEVNFGEVVRPVYERVERAERLRAALAAAGHPLVPPAGHGPAPCTPALVGFLEEAWPAWRAAGGQVLIPDSFPNPRLARGGGRDLGGATSRPGWFCFDTATPVVAGSYAAAVAAADVALTGADLVAGGARAAYTLCRPPGHHAGPGYYGGFCLLNNAAIAARALAGLGRVAIVDVDFHHGNGTQDIFWEDPTCCTCRCTATRPAHYPHFTGAADEAGGGPGRGATRNLPARRHRRRRLPGRPGRGAGPGGRVPAGDAGGVGRLRHLRRRPAGRLRRDHRRLPARRRRPGRRRPCWSRRAATPWRPSGPTRSPCWTGSAPAPDRPYRSTRSFARYVLTSASWASRLALPRLGFRVRQGRPRRRPAGASGFRVPSP